MSNSPPKIRALMENFAAKRVVRTRSILLNASVEKVFPLFTPLGEKAWAEGWNPQILHPASGETVEGMVFVTRHGGDEQDTIWTVSVYSPEKYFVRYLRVSPESRLGVVEVSCAAADLGKTQATVIYEFTALSEQGNQFIDDFTEEHYQQYISEWESAINDYLSKQNSPSSGFVNRYW